MDAYCFCQVRTAVMNFAATGQSGGSAKMQTIREQLHLGAKKFLNELRDSESVWSLMVDGAGRGGGVNSTRICPIFVLSLKNLADPYLVDGKSVMATHGDGSVIITGSSSNGPARKPLPCTSLRCSIPLSTLFNSPATKAPICRTSPMKRPSRTTPTTCHTR